MTAKKNKTPVALPGSLKEKWDDLLKQGQSISFKAGQVLFYEGHLPYGLIVIQSGKVLFSKWGRPSSEKKTPCGEEHVVCLGPTKVFGIQPFFEGVPYCCSCTAASDCEGVFISKTQLLPLLPT